jgi:phosphoglycolate phosphatase-like HAD superfamily hydrolase
MEVNAHDILVVFDIDGTLTNTKSVDDECLQKTFRDLFLMNIEGFDWDKFSHATDWSVSQELYKKQFGNFPSFEDYSKIIDCFTKNLENEKCNCPEKFLAIENASNCIDFLTSKGYSVAFATGSWEQSAIVKLSSLGIQPYDFSWSNSSKFISREEIMLDAIHQEELSSQKRFKKIVYFGDGQWDVETCEKLGIPLIGIDVQKNGMLSDLGVEYVFNDYQEIDKIEEAILRL